MSPQEIRSQFNNSIYIVFQGLGFQAQSTQRMEPPSGTQLSSHLKTSLSRGQPTTPNSCPRPVCPVASHAFFSPSANPSPINPHRTNSLPTCSSTHGPKLCCIHCILKAENNLFLCVQLIFGEYQPNPRSFVRLWMTKLNKNSPPYTVGQFPHCTKAAGQGNRRERADIQDTLPSPLGLVSAKKTREPSLRTKGLQAPRQGTFYPLT